MKFKLTLETKKSEIKISYTDKLVLLGSCFTENIGAKLNNHLFSTLENPHGILFNPVSVFNALDDYINCKTYQETDLFFHNDVWNSWQHHSRFSGVDKKATIDHINASIKEAHHYLKTADHLLITLGSAWLYHLNKEAPLGNGQVVANNHKGPNEWFSKSLMNPADLIKKLLEVITALNKFNPHLQLIFTISPVRHLREGLVENNRSKAVLIHAVHEVIAFNVNAHYFPAYELVMDDLRDYRFYAEDLVHPNYAATGYVWEKLVETFMDNTTQDIMKHVAALQLAVQHKPFFKGSSAHQQFLQQSLQKAKQLTAQYPFLPLQNHLQFFTKELANNA